MPVSTPHILSFTVLPDPNRSQFRVTITNSSSVEVVNELVNPPVVDTHGSVDVTPFMIATNQPSGDYSASIRTVGPGGESDPVLAGLFNYFLPPNPVASASIT